MAISNISTTGESTQQGSRRCRNTTVEGVADQGG